MCQESPIRGNEPNWLLTSLVDAKAFPKKELVSLYHERREHELAYDEIKTDMLMQQNSLRSTSPERVAQEIWGIKMRNYSRKRPPRRKGAK